MSKLLNQRRSTRHASGSAAGAQRAALRIVLGGRVQGLGVRPAVARLAQELALAGSITARFEAFGIPACALDTSDVQEIHPAAGRLLEQVRSAGKPQALVLDTCRFGPHSKGDDTREAALVARLRQEQGPEEPRSDEERCPQDRTTSNNTRHALQENRVG